MFEINYEESTKIICDEIRRQNEEVTHFVKDVKKYFDIVPEEFSWDAESSALRKHILKQVDTYLKD